jgi:hypothetical protein
VAAWRNWQPRRTQKSGDRKWGNLRGNLRDFVFHVSATVRTVYHSIQLISRIWSPTVGRSPSSLKTIDLLHTATANCGATGAISTIFAAFWGAKSGTRASSSHLPGLLFATCEKRRYFVKRRFAAGRQTSEKFGIRFFSNLLILQPGQSALVVLFRAWTDAVSPQFATRMFPPDCRESHFSGKGWYGF